MSSQPRFIIGIDLGTSSSALSWIDTLSEEPKPQVMDIVQLDSPSSTIRQTTLPSFLYLPTPLEQQSIGETNKAVFGEHGEPQVSPTEPSSEIPEYVAGAIALIMSSDTPERVVHSAKSWLCHRGIDPEALFLPWGSSSVSSEEKWSAVQTCAAYLAHLRANWNQQMAQFEQDYRLENQQVIITVPASFDEVAQALTRQAAILAGLSAQVRLLEEPQAAFYHWLESHPHQLEVLRNDSDSSAFHILVCDIGGGTTDFSLFQVSPSSSIDPNNSTFPQIERLRVSDHILLGGDNIDLTLAHQLEQRLKSQGIELSTKQWSALVHQSRAAKESLLNQTAETSNQRVFRIVLPAEGRSLFADSISIEVEKELLESVVLEGFFPFVEGSARPGQQKSGFSELGLPYAGDSAITRHLAAFVDSKPIDAVLYAGGTLIPKFLRERLTEQLTRWNTDKSPTVLENQNLSLAIAKGAAYYGYLQRTKQQLIGGGYPHCLYLEIKHKNFYTQPKAVCLLKQGALPGQIFELEGQNFQVAVGRPVRFQAWYSNYRHDQVGDVVELNGHEFKPLTTLHTSLDLLESEKNPVSAFIDVKLISSINELGILEITCHSLKHGSPDEQCWLLELSLQRSDTSSVEDSQEPNQPSVACEDGSVSPELMEKARALIQVHYGKQHSQQKPNPKQASSPQRLLKELEGLLSRPRADWGAELLRGLWPSLNQGLTKRSRSLQHETSWLTLAGFCLRPGFGDELDPFRIDELWRTFELGLFFPKESSAQIQWWIMWRRVAGGLNQARQSALWQSVQPQLNKKDGNSPELLALGASLERISEGQKIELGNRLVRLLAKDKTPAYAQIAWAFGRLSSRVPLYSGPEHTLAPEVIWKWFERLKVLDWTSPSRQPLQGAFTKAARIAGDRYLDLTNAQRQAVAEKLRVSGAGTSLIEPLEKYIPADRQDAVALFGETLPLGLRLKG